MSNFIYSKNELQSIAYEICKEIYIPSSTSKISIFLCGGKISDKKTYRYKVSQLISTSFWYSYDYTLIYPEYIFQDLLSSYDLLSLENMLAESVDAVVILLESPGAISELGAFSNNEKLRSKIICVIDEKYKKIKSFINKGPVKLIRAANKDAIIYANLDELGKEHLGSTFSSLRKDPIIDRILKSVRLTKKLNQNQDSSKLTLLQIDKFLLASIYLLEPAAIKDLTLLVSFSINELKYAKSSTEIALNMLVKNRQIELSSDGFRLTRSGTKDLLSFRDRERNSQLKKTIVIDALRLEILNLKYRNKKMKV